MSPVSGRQNFCQYLQIICREITSRLKYQILLLIHHARKASLIAPTIRSFFKRRPIEKWNMISSCIFSHNSNNVTWHVILWILYFCSYPGQCHPCLHKYDIPCHTCCDSSPRPLLTYKTCSPPVIRWYLNISKEAKYFQEAPEILIGTESIWHSRHSLDLFYNRNTSHRADQETLNCHH